MTLFFVTKTEQKRELERINNEYDETTEIIKEYCLNIFREFESGSEEHEAAHDLYWAIPHYPYQFSEKKAKMFRNIFPEVTARLEGLRDLHKAVKNYEFTEVPAYEDPVEGPEA